ncbi:MAG: thymidylate synthase (FAD) [Desulfurococcales archaeon ex4484_217_2]|nr:MAG: thymidylate synthase (FAD) [Desulfurococcales archaeon ex4484_217_2]
MEQLKVKLLNASPLEVADLAISKCWDKPSKDQDHMIERMYRVGIKNKHASTLEHLVYTFDIDGISRACLQELARHRMASLSVKSTRYTLKELQNAETVSDFLVSSGDYEVDEANIVALQTIQYIMSKRSIANDKIKYCLPEAYKTSLVWTINARSLRNFLELRTSRAALEEIQTLALRIYMEVPDEHKFLFSDCIQE